MSKTRLPIMVLMICLVLGTIPFAMGATPTASISSLYVGAAGQTANQEYVQITNTGTTAVNMNGWKLTDQGALHVYTFSYTLKAKSTVTLRSGSGKNTATTLYWNKYSFIWNNTGDKAYLYNAQGKLVSSKVGSKVK
jgi:Lamin Tail Domain